MHGAVRSCLLAVGLPPQPIGLDGSLGCLRGRQSALRAQTATVPEQLQRDAELEILEPRLARRSHARSLAGVLRRSRAPREPPSDRAPWHPRWSNSIAICAVMRGENATDVREWLGYYRCGTAVPVSLRLQSRP